MAGGETGEEVGVALALGEAFEHRWWARDEYEQLALLPALPYRLELAFAEGFKEASILGGRLLGVLAGERLGEDFT